MPHAGTCSPEEHADQVVVPPAAAEAAGEIRHGDLEDRAGVVRQPARQARIEAQMRRLRSWPSTARTICRRSASASTRAAAIPAEPHSRLNAHESAFAVAVSPWRPRHQELEQRPAAGLAATPRVCEFRCDTRRARSCRACRARRARRRGVPSARPPASSMPASTPAVIQADREVRESQARAARRSTARSNSASTTIDVEPMASTSHW